MPRLGVWLGLGRNVTAADPAAKDSRQPEALWSLGVKTVE